MSKPIEGKDVMRIGFIPGAMDTLSGEHFPHLVHMQENIAGLRKKAEINVIMADRVNARFARFQQSRLYKIVNRKHMHIVRKLLHFVLFLAAYMEVKKNANNQQNDLFLVRFCFPNYLICRYLRYRGYKILLEVHALTHVEEKEYGQTYIPSICSEFYFAIIRYLEKKTLGWAHQITTVSQSLKSAVIDLGIAEARIHVIANAVDLDRFDYMTAPANIVKRYRLESKIVIGFVGSFARYHGIEILLGVAEALQKRYDNIRFLLVGRNIHGSDNPMAEVFTRGLSHLFAFTGEVLHSKIPLYISAMDIGIIPDFNTYGSPMKLFEYMAMKKPVVAPDVPPIIEVVEDGQTAILFERGNVAEAVRAVETLLEDEKLRREVGQRARFKVISSYTWDRNAERILKIADRMME